MEPRFLRPDVECFFGRVGVPDGRFRELRLIDPANGRVHQHFCGTIPEAIEICDHGSDRLNVYVGACPRFYAAGSRDAVRFVSGAWADLDFHQIDPTNRDVALELAYRRIETLGIPPTMLVHSGNGLQVWWLFHQPAAITDEWPAERFEAINIGLAQRLGGDHVHDLARVLRVPGTINLPDAKKRARGCVPVMARLLSLDGPIYDSDEFGSVAAPVTQAPARASERPGVVTQPPEVSTEIVAAFVQLVDQLGGNHPLARTWRGDRTLNDPSRSGWDMALVSQLYRAHIREEFIPAIVRAYPKGRGVFATHDYIARTVAKGRSRLRGRYETPRTA
jgi:hypothetical protein